MGVLAKALHSRGALTVIIAVWSLAIVAGMVALWLYKSTPGEETTHPASWPGDSSITREPGFATLVMLAHPRCSCTRASIGELAVLMSRLGDRLRAHVLFVKPEGAESAFAETGTWDAAAAIPGVRVSLDEGGQDADLFGALTSGQTVLYDADGRLLFAGGITGARGHMGDNPGRGRIVALLTTGAADRQQSPVFGCELDDAAQESQ